MARGQPKARRSGAAAQTPLVVRTTPEQEARLARVRERRDLPTRQQAASAVLSAGLRALALEDAVTLHRNGQSLEAQLGK